jgi:hypothetical protein
LYVLLSKKSNLVLQFYVSPFVVTYKPVAGTFGLRATVTYCPGSASCILVRPVYGSSIFTKLKSIWKRINFGVSAAICERAARRSRTRLTDWVSVLIDMRIIVFIQLTHISKSRV